MLERRRARGPVLLALVAGLSLVLAACGVPDPGTDPGAAPSAGFPVSVEHALGTTEIPAAPERVVSLGYTDQDAILALGVVPVAIREFTGGQPSATWPWASDLLQGQQPEVLDGEVGLEAVAALAPDLIVAVSAGLTREQYDSFSRIAPVITQPVGDQPFQSGWQDTTRLIGQALGRSTEADGLVTDLEARFNAVAAEYPQLAGKRAAVAAVSSVGGGQFFVWTSQDNRGRFLTSLGLTVPATFDGLAGENFYADISGEQLGLLDETDVLVWLQIPGTENATLQEQAGYPTLRIGQEGRVYDMTAEQAVALSFSSVLSLPSLLDTVPGELAARVGG
ncbi:iron-siderophore ABC transporter substrate-binding protein [Pseudonocardia abyssalis]|uniref:Iron-siderophore ABC transporter substrate-binding protein n=1 Tax=Pseudonocardia abyssalis TaxID=2792008 RepID=A0ABS6UN75_9PSEU|nr:iron-siderophore ABC transporter substrate-binding protein [Pseudonocardia abyssalis]MBW0115436.1 iron-siderophore ABC transporter substrate-binding protein [Pseudonocardia abyssalis]MBW0133703.1 iron-siderophore ABC transporter substrate-binding protein [Pseudonocardia abyssalis]